MVKDENYYTVCGWMRNRLHLKGNDLIVYALIYSFSQDGESEFKGSLSYITEFTGASQPTINRSLLRLKDLGLIEKTEYNASTGRTNGYKCVALDELIFEPYGGNQNDCPPQSKCLTGTIKLIGEGNQNDLRDKSIYNKVYNKDRVSKKVSNKYNAPARELESYEELFEEYGVRGDYREAFFEFIKHCCLNKKIPTNDKLLDMIVRLDLAYRDNDKEKAKAVRRAVSGGYFDVKAG